MVETVTPAGAVTFPLIVAPLTRVALIPVRSWPAATVTAVAASKEAAFLYHWSRAPVFHPENWSLYCPGCRPVIL